MFDKKIYKHVNDLIELHGTNDPFKLAELIGLIVASKDIGSLNGVYCCTDELKCIIINENVDEVTAKVICAHELGHSILHENEKGFLDSSDTWLSPKNKSLPEIEANHFAADLLISDEDLFDLASYEYTIDQMAVKLGVHTELLILKLHLLNDRGYEFNIPYLPQSNFMAKI